MLYEILSNRLEDKIRNNAMVHVIGLAYRKNLEHDDKNKCGFDSSLVDIGSIL